MIELHSNGSPNSQKVAIFLTEAELDHRRIMYDVTKGEHLVPEFRRINPNNKLPAIVDYAPVDKGAPLAVFESGAILIYLAEKTSRFLPTDPRGRSLAIQWLTWQVAGLGPMHGQANHFVRYAPEGQEYSVARYTKEARRLVNVLEYRLKEAPFLAGEYSIADMACWPWINIASIVGIALKDFANVERWWKTISERPAVQAVLNGAESVPARLLGHRVQLTPEEWSNTFGENMLSAAR